MVSRSSVGQHNSHEANALRNQRNQTSSWFLRRLLLDGYNCQYGSGNPQLMGRRTLRHKRSLDWFSYSVIGIHWLQSDIIIAEISNAVSWSIDVFFQPQYKPSFSSMERFFLGTSPFLSSVRSFYRTFWRTQISNNRYVCYKNRDAKPKLRRSNL